MQELRYLLWSNIHFFILKADFNHVNIFNNTEVGGICIMVSFSIKNLVVKYKLFLSIY